MSTAEGKRSKKRQREKQRERKRGRGVADLNSRERDGERSEEKPSWKESDRKENVQQETSKGQADEMPQTEIYKKRLSKAREMRAHD